MSHILTAPPFGTGVGCPPISTQHAYLEAYHDCNVEKLMRGPEGSTGMYSPCHLPGEVYQPG